jgi:transcriptional regulator with XRE-family HTH domain
VAEGSPTVRRRELGALLRKLREDKGLSVKDVTDHLLCSPSKVSRIETGQRGATLRDIRDLCDLYGVTDTGERERLTRLVKEGKEQGWWQAYDLAFATPAYVGLEAEATRIRDYDPGVIPGLLQTPGYVRALHLNPMPEPDGEGVTPEKVNQRVEVRLRRQQLLTRTAPPPLNFWAILDEAVLHREIGGPSVMRAQLQFVIDRMQLANVTVQVIPNRAGAHPALGSTFNIVEFDGRLPDIVYSETLAGFFFIEKREEVERFTSVFERLSNIALSSAESAEMMLEVSKKYDATLRAVS